MAAVKNHSLKSNLELPNVQLYKIQILKVLMSYICACKTNLKTFEFCGN